MVTRGLVGGLTRTAVDLGRSCFVLLATWLLLVSSQSLSPVLAGLGSAFHFSIHLGFDSPIQSVRDVRWGSRRRCFVFNWSCSCRLVLTADTTSDSSWVDFVLWVVFPFPVFILFSVLFISCFLDG